jgi:thiosulfate/3-mercaptopyruvate sulfurtransferase
MSSEVLISAHELAEMLRSDQPPLIADVRWNLGGPPGKPDFEASHIPGAVWVDLETQLAGPPGVGGRHPLPTVAIFEEAMRSIGVCQDSLVVAYDAANSQAAARLWWLLTDAGHRPVKVLDGGFAAWKAAGLSTISGPSAQAARGDFIAHPGQQPQLAASGITATHSLLALESAGLGAAALYPGSWSDWIRDSSRPIATGTAP